MNARVLLACVAVLPQLGGCVRSAPNGGQARGQLSRRSAVGLVPAIGSALPAALGAASPLLQPAAPAFAASGKSALQIPDFGIGAWAWGDSLFWGYDSKRDGDLREVFDYTVSEGVKFFDTAEVYGIGRSETLLGDFCKANPGAADVRIATKFAALPWRTKPETVLAAARKSADRLGRPIDLYQIHFPGAWANEAYWDGLAQAVDEGLVGAAGVSNYGKDALRACHAKLASRGIPLVSNQIQLSLLYPFCLSNGLKAACDDLGVRVLAYSPLCLGLLTGKYTETNLPSGPRKALAQKALADPGYKQLMATLTEVGAQGHSGASPAQVALAWTIAKGTTPIPGARTLSQAKSNLAARKLVLSTKEVQQLDAASAAVTPILSPDANPFPKVDKDTGLRMYDS
eukprot:CAMPEP_0185188828 /NCGR_PEP_ID=MMETSP1140-20130426/5646_1 /TAXON_ID=298111 /ORGANISM="Pavlova sp., Strain CCMP459" /LENGTH=399 /DNA_ID=CAMNT_0027755343 /DNA_START=11 /DNA_END=1210 /DNA_ORIENTATION=-